jgi:hypothetical protein
MLQLFIDLNETKDDDYISLAALEHIACTWINTTNVGMQINSVICENVVWWAYADRKTMKFQQLH